jgi:hypothetical protein
MSEEYNFSKQLVASIKLAKPHEREEVLTMIFKSYVAKLIGMLMERSGNANGLEADIIVSVRSNLIHEFRKAKLDVNQRSVKMYEDLFDKTLEEILNYAAHANAGEDSAQFANRVMDINPREYVNNGGLYLPS